MTQAAAYLSVLTVVLSLGGLAVRRFQAFAWGGVLLVALCLIGDVLTQ